MKNIIFIKIEWRCRCFSNDAPVFCQLYDGFLHIEESVVERQSSGL